MKQSTDVKAMRKKSYKLRKLKQGKRARWLLI
jgi:hypothetical protein